MKEQIMMRAVTVLILFIGMLHGNVSAEKTRIHASLAPTANFRQSIHNRSYAFGISVPIRHDKLRIGLDVIGTVWQSYYSYSFEKHLRFDRYIGGTEELRPHFLAGFAPNFVWIYRNDESLWHQTMMTTGIIINYPDFSQYWRSLGGKPMDIMSPYLRFQRVITSKLPAALMVQFTYVPGAGLISSLLVGVDMNLIFWRK